MDDTCEALLANEDVQEFYIGDQGGQHSRHPSVEAEEKMALIAK